MWNRNSGSCKVLSGLWSVGGTEHVGTGESTCVIYNACENADAWTGRAVFDIRQVVLHTEKKREGDHDRYCHSCRGSCGCFGGCTQNIFAAVVRGTDGNLDLLTDVIDGSVTMFEQSGQNVRTLLVAFMEEATGKSAEELKAEDNYFFFTEHSLGDAVANYLSVDGEILKYVGSDKGRIYTYTFESPHTCVHLIWNDSQSMSNAFNFKIFDDYVTKWPEYCGATTYGRDQEFKVSSLDNSLYQRLFKDAKAEDIDGACSRYWHDKDIYGLHDTMLGLLSILTKAEADGENISPAIVRTITESDPTELERIELDQIEPDQTEPDQTESARMHLQMAAGQYEYNAGMGYASVTFTLNEDGTFTGTMSDTNSGESGVTNSEESYSGTVYYCNFSGKYEMGEQLTEYSYDLLLTEYNCEGTDGDSYIEDGIRYVNKYYWEFARTDGGILYTPDTPSSQFGFDPYEYIYTDYRGYIISPSPEDENYLFCQYAALDG